MDRLDAIVYLINATVGDWEGTEAQTVDALLALDVDQDEIDEVTV